MIFLLKLKNASIKIFFSDFSLTFSKKSNFPTFPDLLTYLTYLTFPDFPDRVETLQYLEVGMSKTCQIWRVVSNEKLFDTT